jgi:hypothetical protein
LKFGETWTVWRPIKSRTVAAKQKTLPASWEFGIE